MFRAYISGGCHLRPALASSTQARFIVSGLKPETTLVEPEPPTAKQWEAIEPTTLEFFHNPEDETSVHILQALQDARLCYPRPSPRPYPHRRWRGPLKMDILVHERPPSADEFRQLVLIQPSISFSAFLRPTARMKYTPTSAQSLADTLAADPTSLYWPIFVDWVHKDHSIGGYNSVKIVRRIARRRDKFAKMEESIDCD
ncbi:hypothetical protein B0H11DRAFT_766851 [Mycena galericulata]|nr:hypothetical protein B0H11DRAFT_766851 [Mycena galericulata]